MNIVFDMYGVIIKESKGNFIPYVYKHFPFMDKKLLVSHFNKAGIGEMSAEDFISSLGFSDSAAVTEDYIENYLTFDKSFNVFADKYKDSFKLALLSNDVLRWSEYITKHYGIDKYFKYKIISGSVGSRKPDKKIFQVFLDQSGWLAEDCIFVDNGVANLLAAAELGFKTVLFNRDYNQYSGDIVYSFDELGQLVEEKYI